MPRRIRATVFAFASLLFVIVLGCMVGACATRPLVLQPAIKPLDFAPERRYEPLHLISFADELVDEKRAFGEQKKRFRDPPVDVLNDALLLSLRESQGFEVVDRDQPSSENGYILEGRLIALGTDESPFKFGLASSTMKIAATCVTEVRLKNAKTGEVLLEATVTTTGGGSAQTHGGGTGFTTTFDSSGNLSHGATQNSVTYDSTVGYEESMSAAIANNVSTITGLAMTELRRRAELAETEPATTSDPTQASATDAATPQGEVSGPQEDPPAVSAPAPE